MFLTLTHFTDVRGRELVLTRDGSGELTGVADRPQFRGREVGWLAAESPDHDNADQHRENAEAKQAFLQTLAHEWGSEATNKALERGSFPQDWASDASPLCDRDVGVLTTAAQELGHLDLVLGELSGTPVARPGPVGSPDRFDADAVLSALRNAHVEPSARNARVDLTKALRDASDAYGPAPAA